MRRPFQGRCQVTVYATCLDSLDRFYAVACDHPIVPGALFCARHESDRIRLGGTPR